MKAPRTRIAEGATDFERDLLRSWERERPSDEARQGALALVGVAAALGGSTTASTAAAAGLKAATGSMAPKAATLGATVLAKWAIVGAVVAVAAGGVAVEHSRSSSKETPVRATVPVVAPMVRSVATPPPSLQAAVPVPRATATVEAPLTSSQPPAAMLPPPAPAAQEPRPALGLGQQVAALDQARDALASGNASVAIRLVDDYDRQFPRGALAQEATALRIEALFLQGNRDAATHLADRFLAANPRSPHAARIRLLVQRAQSP
jgi:hypothetical protein